MGGSISKQQMESLIETFQSSVTSVMMRSSQKIVNIVSNDQILELKVGGDVECFNVSQRQLLDINYVSNIGSEAISDIKSSLESSVEQNIEQIMDIMREMGASWGSYSDDDMALMIESRITQIINNTVTVDNVNNDLSSTVNLQKMVITIGGSIKGAECSKISQDIQLTISATKTLTNIINSVTSDSIMNRIIHDASQTLKKEETGFAGILKALTGPFIIILIGIIVAGKQGIQSLTNPKFMLVFAGLIAAWLTFSYFLKIWPFKKKGPRYGCQIISGKFTGVCEENPDGKFSSLNECKINVAAGTACQQYWGCDTNGGLPTGDCKQFTTVMEGPFYNQAECRAKISAGKSCQQYWGCGKDINGFPTEPASCKQYPENLKPLISFKNQAECDSSKMNACSPIWNCLKKKTGSNPAICKQKSIATEGSFNYPSKSKCETECI